MNTETFTNEFGSLVNSKIDVSRIYTRKQAWDVYFSTMLEAPVLVMNMPEPDIVTATMKDVFCNVDWIN